MTLRIDAHQHFWQFANEICDIFVRGSPIDFGEEMVFQASFDILFDAHG